MNFPLHALPSKHTTSNSVSERNQLHLFWQVAARGRATPAHAQNHLSKLRMRGDLLRRSLPLSGRFPPVGFPRGAGEAGPGGQDGVGAGPEARAAAGQRPRRPPRLPTGSLQVGGQGPALSVGVGLGLAGFLQRGLGLGHLGGSATLVKDNRPSLCLASLCPGVSRREARQSCDMQTGTHALHRCPASWSVPSIAKHSLCDLGKVLGFFVFLNPFTGLRFPPLYSIALNPVIPMVPDSSCIPDSAEQHRPPKPTWGLRAE